MAGRNAVEYAARRACIPWMPCRTRAKLRIFQPLGIALALVAALVATACRAATIDVSVDRSGDTMLIEAHARLDADLATSWDVLTDYAHYPAFVRAGSWRGRARARRSSRRAMAFGSSPRRCTSSTR